tara:strand:+ start:1420 stop:4224 length:2805 start_codon:yes stop_codon:yes gene_type:complete
MANTIKLKRGTSTPSTSDISNGEVAIDTSAKKLYVNDSGTVKEIGGSGTIGGASGIDFNDDVNVRFGTGNDMILRHNGSNSFIENSTGNLILRPKTDEEGLVLRADGASELYYDNSKKFETTSTGSKVTGADLTVIGTEGISAGLYLIADEGDDNGDGWRINSNQDDNDLTIANNTSGSYVDKLTLQNDGDLFTTGDLYIKNDSKKLKLGASDDLEIYHDGTDSYVKHDLASGFLKLVGDAIKLESDTSNELYLRADKDAGVSLYYDNSKKLQTNSTGIQPFGNVDIQSGGHLYLEDDGEVRLGNSGDLQLFHNSSTGESRVYNSNAGGLILVSDSIKLRNNANNEHFLTAANNSMVELFYDNSKKFETTSAGVSIHGHLDMSDSKTIRLGTSSDLQIYHDGANSVIYNTFDAGQLRLYSNNILFQDSSAGDTHFSCDHDAAVKLYYDNSNKLETYSSGVYINGQLAVVGHSKPFHNNTYDLGDAASRWRDLYMGRDIYIPDNGVLRIGNATYGDLKLYHDGSNSYIKDAGTGALRLFTNEFAVYNADGSEWLFKAAADGASSLKYDGTTKVETLSGGAKVTGALEITSTTNISSGNLQIGGTNVINSGRALYNVESVKLADSKELILGSGDDLKIYHDGNNSWINDSGTGSLYLKTNSHLYILDGDNDTLLEAVHNGGITLKYNNSTKLATNSSGVNVTGNLRQGAGFIEGSGERALHIGSTNAGGAAIYFDGDSNGDFSGSDYSWIKHNTSGHLDIAADNPAGNGSIYLYVGHANQGAIYCYADDRVELYYDGTSTCQTTSSGFYINSNKDLRFSNGNWTGESTKIQHHSNWLYIQSGSNGIIFRHSDGNNRWLIDSSGHFQPAINNTYDIGTSSYRVRNIYTNDLHLSNEGSSNDVDGTWGSFTIQEGAEDLYLVNKRNGKKYKFNLTEVA